LDDAPLPASWAPLVVDPASERITIRLRAGDRQRIRERAAARRMKDAGYLAALVRAHVVANPPLPAAELQQLKATVAALRAAIADLSINLQVLARDRESVDTLWRDLRQTRAQVVDLERQFHAYTLAAVIAWEASSA
jgi:predicted DNA binding CopG/RHH family protein